MNSPAKNILLAGLGLVIVFLGYFSWQQRQQNATLEETVSRYARERSMWQTRVAELEQRAAAAEKARSETEARLAETRPTPAATRADPARARAAIASPLDNPATQRMMATTLKSTLDQRYGALFRQLKLSPADLDKFKDLLTERQMSTLDAVRALQSQGGGAASARELPELMRKVQGDVDESIRGLLGDDRFQQYQDFNQNLASYTLLEQIERRLSYTSSPLQQNQSTALARVLIETAQPNPALGGMGNLVQSLGGSSPMVTALVQRPISDDTIARAQGILEPAQVDVLRQIQAEQQAQANMIQSLRANAGSAAPRGNAIVVPVEEGQPAPGR
jgi:hypothetical protein